MNLWPRALFYENLRSLAGTFAHSATIPTPTPLLLLETVKPFWYFFLIHDSKI